jgi:hypothetical protein
MPGRRATPPAQRPGLVAAALVLTWVAVGICGVLGLLAFLLAGNHDLLAGVQSDGGSGVSRHAYTTVMRQWGPILFLWSALVAVVAGFAWRGQGWAHAALTGLGLVYCAVVLLRVGLSLPSLTNVFWVGMCLGLMWTSPARRWFAGRDRSQAYDVPTTQVW